ncbi:hypothetical protein FHR72_000397 [Mycolicibacterium iranicum]|uniref:ESX-1 secretion-associated protein EspB PE domain-containing protein n=1 Tax=Mycolicibacterium iranicum TaxID=912594 RepID=A0A839PY32_MYCIR|nr:PPE domain-containing protein [Mycolicibacterium iranicum]MBB2988940.1 hypothetical protein [Mycolicibacterium iranicum]
MSGEELQVEPSDLTGKATQIRGLTFASMGAQPALISPDALIISSVAITNLSANAENLWAFQEYGRVEGQRLAQTLDNVAAAYSEVDQMAGQDIGSTMGVPGGPGSGSVMPKGVDIPALPHPPKMPIPKGQLPPDPMLDPVQTQTALDAGDDAASLRAAATMWRQNATSLETSAQQFETNTLLWEGQAADAAYAKFNSYRDWLIGLAGSWKQLAGEADRLASAHDAAKADHRPIAEEYKKLYEQMMSQQNPAQALPLIQRMAELQTDSEELRNKYARDGQPYQVEPQDPPSPVVGGTPVTVDDHRRARKPGPGEGSGGQNGSGAPGSGGGQPQGGQPQTPQEAPVSPMSADQASQAAQQGGSPGGQQGGGQQGGGQQGGSPGGGSPGGSPGSGMPTPGKGPDPKLPTDPSLKPAASGGGSAGGGGAGGGGGVPQAPLQPAVGAETVAPTPVVPGAPIPVASTGTGGGAMGGGMSGMAPMHGAHGAGAGEKKRNPQLSPDEPLYVEDRPHTEQVIGVRPRRRGAPDDTKRGEAQ